MKLTTKAAVLLAVLTSTTGCGTGRDVATGPRPVVATVAEQAGASAPPTARTSARDPRLDIAAQALGHLVYGHHAPYGDVYGSLQVDYPGDQIVLYVTGLDRGQQLIAAARRARPDITGVTIQMIACRYSSHQESAALQRVLAIRSQLNHPVYGGGPSQDGGGVQIATDGKGLESKAFRSRVEQVAAPVHVEFIPGAPAIPASG